MVRGVSAGQRPVVIHRCKFGAEREARFIGRISESGEGVMVQARFARSMSFAVVVVLVNILAGQSFGQAKAPRSPKATPAPAAERINASAIWKPRPEFLRNAQVACERDPSATFALCLIREMAKAGATGEAVEFSRRLYDQNGGEFGFMWSFQKVGPVDMAKVEYPLRDMDYKYAVGSRSEALFLVNGDPPMLDVDDLTKLDKRGMEQDEGYQLLKKNFPGLELWGGARGGTMFDPVEKRPDGGLSFDIYYVLNPGRPAGRWISGANFSWDFDSLGKFVGTRFAGGVGLLPD